MRIYFCILPGEIEDLAGPARPGFCSLLSTLAQKDVGLAYCCIEGV
jgi:hypothetical protein